MGFHFCFVLSFQTRQHVTKHLLDGLPELLNELTTLLLPKISQINAEKEYSLVEINNKHSLTLHSPVDRNEILELLQVLLSHLSLEHVSGVDRQHPNIFRVKLFYTVKNYYFFFLLLPLENILKRKKISGNFSIIEKTHFCLSLSFFLCFYFENQNILKLIRYLSVETNLNDNSISYERVSFSIFHIKQRRRTTKKTTKKVCALFSTLPRIFFCFVFHNVFSSFFFLLSFKITIRLLDLKSLSCFFLQNGIFFLPHFNLVQNSCFIFFF